MRTLLSGSLVITGLLATTYSAFAEDSFTRQGVLYTCPNQCVITYSSSGQFSVRDSRNAPVSQVPVNVDEVQVNP
jgi:hypothetical protein